MNEFSIIHLANEAQPERFMSAIRRWIVDAEQPFGAWLHGSLAAAEASVQARFEDSASELSLARVGLLLVDGAPAGGFVAGSGTTLARCFVADSLRMLQKASLRDRPAMVARLRAAFAPFPVPRRDAHFLSRMGIDPALRGRGLGRRVLDAFIAQGQAEGYQRYQLNVFAGNTPAVRLYVSAGFQVRQEFLLGGDQFRYFGMMLECA